MTCWHVRDNGIKIDHIYTGGIFRFDTDKLSVVLSCHEKIFIR